MHDLLHSDNLLGSLLSVTIIKDSVAAPEKPKQNKEKKKDSWYETNVMVEFD